jgi:hypothetical protein
MVLRGRLDIRETFTTSYNFSLFQTIQTSCGARPASYQQLSGVISPRVKRLVPEEDHSPPSGAEVKNEWS